MQINSNGYTQANEKAIENTNLQEQLKPKIKDTKELNVEEQINKSAIEVSLSMNAQIVLFSMDTQDYTVNNTKAQNAVLDFLSGKETEGQLSLKDIGYEGKPITELSEDEATQLVSNEGFFGVNETSKRVSDFVFNFSNDNLEIIEQAREGIIKGFEQAQELWGGELPQISHDTQAKTLEIIDARINELKETNNS